MSKSNLPIEIGTLTPEDIHLSAELPKDSCDIDRLLDLAFGPDRQGKAVYRFRENLAPIAELSMVARVDGILRGAIRYSPVKIGDHGASALLLGPLAVDPAFRGAGVGLSLMRHTLEVSRELGHKIVVLVGDEPYYARVGFSTSIAKNLIISGQADRNRILGLALVDGAMKDVEGILRPDHGPSVS
jgi:predicted N-acetyltransferase YhbS